MDNIEKLRKFYENEGDEELRLTQSGVHKLEFLTATTCLERYLKPGSKILDSCAGSGAYSFWLAGRVHSVTAGDIVPHNVEIIRQKQKANPVLKEIYLGDALDLSRFDSESFDATLLMGVLYHLDDAAGRKRAIEESLRVTRRGGLFACTYMNRHAVILNNSSGSLDNIADIMRFLSDGREGIFYASTPGETEELLRTCGVTPVCHAALDGVACLMRETAALLDETGLERWREYHLASCEEPSLLGYSYHCMIIGKKA